MERNIEQSIDNLNALIIKAEALYTKLNDVDLDNYHADSMLSRAIGPLLDAIDFMQQAARMVEDK